MYIMVSIISLWMKNKPHGGVKYNVHLFLNCSWLLTISTRCPLPVQPLSSICSPSTVYPPSVRHLSVIHLFCPVQHLCPFCPSLHHLSNIWHHLCTFCMSITYAPAARHYIVYLPSVYPPHILNFTTHVLPLSTITPSFHYLFTICAPSVHFFPQSVQYLSNIYPAPAHHLSTIFPPFHYSPTSAAGY